MKFLKLIPILFIFFGNVPYKNEVHAEIKNPKDFRVLSNESKKLSISNVEYFIKEGDKYIKNGDFEKAKDSYLDARKLAKQLASFYSDLNSSFKGIDARIPKEMQKKGKQTLQILAESNKRLASKKTTSITIIPIGIAYSKIPPNFRGEFCLSFGKPIPINDYSNFTIKDFNKFLNEKMTQEEEKALKNVGR